LIQSHNKSAKVIFSESSTAVGGEVFANGIFYKKWVVFGREVL
jgi:hypothetical protein